MNGPVDVLEDLASWCNEKNIGKAEYERRSLTYAAVAELIELNAVQRAALDRADKVLIEFEGMTGAGYRYMAECIRAALANIGDTK